MPQPVCAFRQPTLESVDRAVIIAAAPQAHDAAATLADLHVMPRLGWFHVCRQSGRDGYCRRVGGAAAWCAAVKDAVPPGFVPLPQAPSDANVEAETAAAAAAAAVIASVPLPSTESLAAPFPPPPAFRRRAAGGEGKKPTPAMAASPTSAAPQHKIQWASDNVAGGACSATELIPGTSSPAQTPEAVAAWALESGAVCTAVCDGIKELWAALEKRTAQLEHLRAASNRIEAHVDGQGQCNECTVMALASSRVAVKSGARAPGSSGNANDKRRNKDVKPMLQVEDVKASAMALASANDLQAAQLQRPIRTVMKRCIAAATISREVLMDPEVVRTVIHEETIKALVVTPEAADSYHMNRIYFSSLAADAEPT